MIHDKRENLAHAQELLRKAARGGIDLAVLPAMFCCPQASRVARPPASGWDGGCPEKQLSQQNRHHVLPLCTKCGESYPRLAWGSLTADTGYGKGDMNGDGYVNAVDAMLVLRAVAGLTALTSAQSAADDVNGDGEINSADARLILCYNVEGMTAFE